MGREQGYLASCAPPCLTARCAAFLAPEDWLCPSPCPPPAHRERRDTGGARTYLPRAHGDRQRVCLSHLCCRNGVWRRKEKAFVLQRAPVHPCCLLVGLGDGSVPAAHGACSKAAALLLGTSHTSCSMPVAARPSCWPQDGVGGKAGGSGTHPKQGAPFSPPRCPFPPPGCGTEAARPPGHSAWLPFLLP